MTPQERRDICLYRLEQAENTLQDAQLLFANQSLIGAMNRLYYAMFYAVSALACVEGFNTKKHTGLQAWFNKHVVNIGFLSSEYGKLFNSAFEWRSKGDYTDLIYLESEMVQQLIEKIPSFIATVRHLTLERLDRLDQEES